jgi:hypothetical protein
MRVGGLEETITVTGESPIVDVQSATLRRTATAQVFKEIPSSGSWTSMAAVMSGVRTSSTDVGGVLGDPTGAMITAHGSRDQDMVSLFDGMRIGNMYQSSNNTNMSLSPLLFEQVDIQMSGQSGETGTNGVILNAIPRSGGNRFSGTALVNGSGPGLQGSNLTDRLVARGASAGNTLKTLYDINGALGGPIKQDKLWFYVTSRANKNEYNIAGNYFPVGRGGSPPPGRHLQAGLRRHLPLRQQRPRHLGHQRQAEVPGLVRVPVPGRSALADRVAHPVHLA